MAKVPEFLDDLDIISKLGNNPGPDDGLEPDPLKSKFDEAGNKIKDFINKYIIPALNNYVAGTDGLLDLTGGTMKGDINLDGKHRITRMADPISAQDGVTKAYADKKYKKLDEGKASLSGASMTGPLSVQEPTGDNDAAPKGFVVKSIQGAVKTEYIVLPDTSWGPDGTQTVSSQYADPGFMNPGKDVFAAPAPAWYDLYHDSRVRLESVGEKTLTFKYTGDKPYGYIGVNVLFRVPVK